MTDKMSFADWARDHAIAAASLDPRAPLDDLEPLREVIGDARVVAIGESAHYVREFYLLRHRLLRFLAERRGFAVYALEAPFTEAHAIDAWVQGGPGTVAEVAATGVAFDQGRSREMHDLLAWMRARNRTASPPLRFAGVGLPASGGSPSPALEEVAAYLRRADPDALPLLEQAAGLARSYHDTATFKAINRNTTLEPAVQDALTAALSRLLSRMETTGVYQCSQHHGQDHATALQHLRGAWYLDHFYRDLAGRGISVEHPHALHDAFMAESVPRLLEDGAPDTRIVLACHNIHIHKTPITHGDAVPLLPQGYHLAEALGGDYLAIAATSNRDRTARMTMDPEHPLGFGVSDCPLPQPADGSVEAAFATEAPLAVADLRTARLAVHDTESFQRMRMEDYFMDVPIFDAFDAIAFIPHTSCAERES
ncbi:MAG: erythromycin esterase family protein [Thermomicrobiales bacterium]